MLRLLFKSNLNQINRSDIRSEKSSAAPAAPSLPVSPPITFADPTFWPGTQPVGSRCWSTWKPIYPKPAFSTARPLGHIPARLRAGKTLGDAAACSIPYLLHCLITVKDNANLEKTWIFLRVGKFWMCPKHIPGPGGFLLPPDSAKLPLPDPAMPRVNDLLDCIEELLWSCPDFLWEALPGLKPPAWANLAEVTWEVATDPFGEQQTITWLSIQCRTWYQPRAHKYGSDHAPTTQWIAASLGIYWEVPQLNWGSKEQPGVKEISNNSSEKHMSWEDA